MTGQTEVFISAARLAAEAEQDGARLSSTPADFALSVAGLNPHEGDFHPMDLGRTAEEAALDGLRMHRVDSGDGSFTVEDTDVPKENDTNGFGE